VYDGTNIAVVIGFQKDFIYYVCNTGKLITISRSDIGCLVENNTTSLFTQWLVGLKIKITNCELMVLMDLHKLWLQSLRSVNNFFDIDAHDGQVTPICRPPVVRGTKSKFKRFKNG